MFNEKNYYREFALDFAAAVSPVVYAEFTDEDTLLIIYMSSDLYEEKTRSLFYGESEE